MQKLCSLELLQLVQCRVVETAGSGGQERTVVSSH